MKLDKENETLQTSIGSILTLIIYLIVSAYAYVKIEVWITKNDNDIMQSTQDGFFDTDYVFDFEQGLNVAIAFTDYSNDMEPILKESFGRIVFRAYEWGIDENGKYFVH